MIKEITWAEAEEIGGFRVDRRGKYAIDENKPVCDMSGAVIFRLATWTETCSGCYDTIDGYPFGEYKWNAKHNCYIGAGCHECGYTGLSRRRWWGPYTEDIQKIEKEEP